MTKVTSLKRLERAIASLGSGFAKNPLETHVGDVQKRLNGGKGLLGEAFAPYKTVRATNQSRPLLRAAKLFDDARYSAAPTLGGSVNFEVTVSGTAAGIAKYQNSMRPFLGFNSEGRHIATQEIMASIAENFNRSRA